MNVARLKRMVEVLLEVEAKHAGHFDMRWYAIVKDDKSGNYIFDDAAAPFAKQHACGSSACAIGWFHCMDESSFSLNPLNPGQAYFDLLDKQYGKLFMPDFYPDADITPRHVINRIREMIGEGV